MKIHAVGLVLGVLASATLCQTVEPGWSGIVTLKTDRAEVESKLGRTRSDGGNYYKLDSGILIRMRYSTETCMPDQYDRGRYRIPKDTVLDYSVDFLEAKLLSDLKFKETDYTKQPPGDVGNEIVFLNEKVGIMLVAYYRDDTKLTYIGKIYYRPAPANEQKLLCEQR